jgi:hypothetical protein
MLSSEPVVVSCDELASKADLGPQIEQALGPNGLGLVSLLGGHKEGWRGSVSAVWGFSHASARHPKSTPRSLAFPAPCLHAPS